MLRNRGFVLLTIFKFFSYISTDQIIYTDGWIPMTNNDIYNQIRRAHSTQYPVYVTMKPHINPGSTFKSEQRKMNNTSIIDHIKKNIDMFERNNDSDQKDKMNQITVINKENFRKAKKVPNIDSNIDNIFILPEMLLKRYDNKDKSPTTTDMIKAAETTNTYQVTEETDLTAEDNLKDFAGYQYNFPTDAAQNLTSTFYKILSKYNINSGDRLQNYGLSLQRKVQTPSADVNGVPLLYKYNNLNHLPVDPLLAVFLSNYGFYLPSLYGIKSNYNNLYGYLASNNIHNNKPFGLYKLFSDTDSTN